MLKKNLTLLIPAALLLITILLFFSWQSSKTHSPLDSQNLAKPVSTRTTRSNRSTRKPQPPRPTTFDEAYAILLKQIHTDEIARSETIHDADVREFQLISIAIESPSIQEIEKWQSLKNQLNKELSPIHQRNLDHQWQKLKKHHSQPKHPFRIVTFQIPHSSDRTLTVVTFGSKIKPGPNQQKILPSGGIEYETISSERSDWTYKHLLKRE